MILTDLLFFVSFQILVVYSLGLLVLKFLGIKLWWVPSIVFGISIGIIILTLSALILGYTNNYNFLPVLILIPPFLLLFQLKNISFKRFSLKNIFNKFNLVTILAIVFCVLVQSLIVFPNGVKPDGSLKVKGVFTEDAMWHVAIINNLKKSIPPENPVFAGEKLTNYNYFSDIYISVIQKFTKIETLTLYFKLIGPLLALLCAASLYFVLKVLTKNQIVASIGILLVTIVSTYYYIFGVFKPGININPSTFFGNDYVSRMVNYQLSFSYLIITTVVFLLLYHKRVNSLKFNLVIALLISGGIGFKSYGTILVIVALYIVGLVNVFRKKFEFIMIAIFSSAFTLTLIFFFLRSNKATESIFAFNPFWLIENIFTDPLRFNIAGWEIKRNYYIANSNYLGVAYLYLKGIAIFLFTQFGLKLLGFLSILKAKESPKKEVILLLAIIASVGIIMPFTFTQEGVKWNTIQFIWYSSFGLGILSTLLISDLQRRLGLKLVVIIMVIAWISFLPGVYYYSKFYSSDSGNLTTYNFNGTQESYQAAKFLSEQPDGVLLTDLRYSQTPFIIAISKKNAYFADGSILSNLLIDWNVRSLESVKFFDNLTTQDYQKAFLQKNNISYIFTAKERFLAVKSLKEIYSNDEISVYRFINSY